MIVARIIIAALSILAVLPVLAQASTINSNICTSPVGMPTITSPTSGTQLTAATIVVSGSADADAEVVIIVDDADQTSVVADNNGDYSGSVSVAAGEHTITVRASNPCDSKTSAGITVIGYAAPSQPDPTPPVTEPTQNPSPAPTTRTPSRARSYALATLPQSSEAIVETKTEDAWLRLAALTDDTVLTIGSDTSSRSVTLSGELSSPGTVVVTRDGEIVASSRTNSTRFQFDVPLKPGLNKFRIEATIDGKKVSADMSIVLVESTQKEAGECNEWGCSIWPYVIAGAGIALIIGAGTFFFLGARRRRNTASNDNVGGPSPFGPN